MVDLRNLHGLSEISARPESKYEKVRDTESALHVEGEGQQQLKICVAIFKNPFKKKILFSIKRTEAQRKVEVPKLFLRNSGAMQIFSLFKGNTLTSAGHCMFTVSTLERTTFLLMTSHLC